MKSYKNQIYGSLGVLIVTVFIVCYILYKNDLLI